MPFDPNEPFERVSTSQSNGFDPSQPFERVSTVQDDPLMRRGGIGKPIPRDEARVIAGQRMMTRENAAGLNDLVDAPNGGVGVYGGTGFSKLVSGLRGAGDVMTLGALEPILASFTKKTELDRALQGAQKQDPLAQEIGANAAMIPGLVKAVPQAAVNLGKSGITALTAKTLAKGGALGAGAGAISGANQELAREIRQDENIDPNNIGSAAIEAAKDPKMIALGAILANAGRDPNKVLQERQQGSAQNIYSILNPGKGSPKLNRLNQAFESGGLVQTLNEIKREGSPKTAKEAIAATERAQNSNWNAVKQIVENNPESVIDVSGIKDSLLNKAESALTDAEASQIKNFANKFNEPLKLGDALDLQKRLNEEWNPNSGISNAAHSEAAAKLSGLLDTAFKQLTGTDKNPYRQWGRLSELKSGFQKAYDSAFAATKKGENAGVLSEIGQGLTSGGINPIHIGKKAIAPVYNAARGRQLGALDREIKGLFSGIQKAEPVPTGRRQPQSDSGNPMGIRVNPKREMPGANTLEEMRSKKMMDQMIRNAEMAKIIKQSSTIPQNESVFSAGGERLPFQAAESAYAPKSSPVDIGELIKTQRLIELLQRQKEADQSQVGNF